MGKRVAIWLHEVTDDEGRVRIGGLQTYVAELMQMVGEWGAEPVLMGRAPTAATLRLGGHQVTVIEAPEWGRGIEGTTARRLGLAEASCIHIVASVHAAPRRLGKLAVGIQHGIYWDRPPHRAAARQFPAVANTLRSWNGARAVNRFSRLVCVDWVYPAMAACLVSPLPWHNIRVIPNFAPDPQGPVSISGAVRCLVFCRRLEPVRGSRIFTEACLALAQRGWTGEVRIVGSGSDEQFMRHKLAHLTNVTFHRLEYERRMEAYPPDSLVAIPSLSTEGTSLTCLEAWSRGALVVAAGVGGLTNLVLDNVNGLLIRPLAGDLTEAIAAAWCGQVEVARLRRAGYDTCMQAFTRTHWARRWKRLLDELSGQPCAS